MSACLQVPVGRPRTIDRRLTGRGMNAGAPKNPGETGSRSVSACACTLACFWRYPGAPSQHLGLTEHGLASQSALQTKHLSFNKIEVGQAGGRFQELPHPTSKLKNWTQHMEVFTANNISKDAKRAGGGPRYISLEAIPTGK